MAKKVAKKEEPKVEAPKEKGKVSSGRVMGTALNYFIEDYATDYGKSQKIVKEEDLINEDGKVNAFNLFGNNNGAMSAQTATLMQDFGDAKTIAKDLKISDDWYEKLQAKLEEIRKEAQKHHLAIPKVKHGDRMVVNVASKEYKALKKHLTLGISEDFTGSGGIFSKTNVMRLMNACSIYELLVKRGIMSWSDFLAGKW